jgi:hypothetical protein
MARNVRRMSTNITLPLSKHSHGDGSDTEDGAVMSPLPFTASDLPPQTNNSIQHTRKTSDASPTDMPASPSPETPTWHARLGSLTQSLSPSASEHDKSPISILEGVETAEPQSQPQTPPAGTAVRARWARAAKIAIMSKTLSEQSETPLLLRPGRQLTGSSAPSERRTRTRRDTIEPQQLRREEKMMRVRVTLRDLTLAQEFNAHGALVRHMQFSPDGSFLATCSWDRTTYIMKTTPGVDGEEPCTHHRKLLHPAGLAGQVAWSPCGQWLLTKLTQSIKVWSIDGTCRATVHRGNTVRSIAWFPQQEGKEPSESPIPNVFLEMLTRDSVYECRDERCLYYRKLFSILAIGWVLTITSVFRVLMELFWHRTNWSDCTSTTLPSHRTGNGSLELHRFFIRRAV